MRKHGKSIPQVDSVDASVYRFLQYQLYTWHFAGLRKLTGGVAVTIERDLLISLLRLTKEGPTLLECVKNETKATQVFAEKLIEKLQKDNMVYLEQDIVAADSLSRLKMATAAIQMGADVEHVSSLLRWQEFEEIAAFALERNGYSVVRNVRFKHAARRWEIDIVGCRKPLTLCMDCKHWRRGASPAVLRRIAEAQVARTRALSEALPNGSLELECVKWARATFIPAILTLMPVSYKFYDRVPVVPVLQLQDFVNQLPAYVESLKFFPKEFSHLPHDF
ncbi:MAG: NERD domain-containing protein [Candidatus Bathyarchaeota archaeon]|nr:NERD domain-containing protein [Candidatus Bathyarchaeota archaeon]